MTADNALVLEKNVVILMKWDQHGSRVRKR